MMRMQTLLIPVAVSLMFLLLICACGHGIPVDRPDHAGTPAGTWYEQAENGSVLTITENRITCTNPGSGSSGAGTYTAEAPWQLQNADGKQQIVIDEKELFSYVDMYYDPSEDAVHGYTWPMLDGDGGYHHCLFLRTAYVAPPAPTYAPPEDLSDPGAQKSFPELRLRSMHVSFYDPGVYHDPSSNMAAEPPFEDHYSYDLEVTEDGSARVSSSFCQEIEVPETIVAQLERLLQDNNIGTINGIDIHTEGLPADAPDYEAEITLQDGNVIRSSANGSSVPANWLHFQEEMHHLLFFTFVDAGYHYNGGEFHSTKPMKRLLSSHNERREQSGITCETIRITPDWKKSYDYSLDTQYFRFYDDGQKYPALLAALEQLSERYRQTAEAELQADYEMMEQLPKSDWQKADRRYCYSLYAVDQWEMNGRIFSFTISEGHANSLGAGRYGYGTYRYIRYHIDTETGEILSLGDLFADAGDAASWISDHMVGSYGTHNDTGKRVHAADFPAAIQKAVRQPEPDGIGFNLYYDYIELWMPRSMFPSSDSQLRELMYYDEVQELLGDTYAEVWG